VNTKLLLGVRKAHVLKVRDEIILRPNKEHITTILSRGSY
jgi:hypothetical protein